jgi:arginyl-tRNA--protein-N-Asp/Glu arginylyltransferase
LAILCREAGKMAYKERFKPAEIFDAGIWKPADDVIRRS